MPAASAVDQTSLVAASPGKTKPALRAAASTLDSLRTAYDRLAAGDSAALPEYNYLTARLLEHIRDAGIRPWHDQVEVDAPRTRYVLRGVQPPDLDVEERRFIPADTLEFSGPYSKTPAIKTGVGAPLLALLETPLGDREYFDQKFRYRNVTALITFAGNTATVDLVDPYETENVAIDGRRYPLHANFGLNVAYALSETRIDKLGIRRLLNPQRFSDTARLTRLQPYDRDRIPVLFVHGLQDTPASFSLMYTSLMADEKIREKYQFWVFSYPSGYPYPYSASLLRKELDRMNKTYPDHKDIVMVGHSMGGLITHLMLTDAGDTIWRSYFGKAPADTAITGSSRSLLEDSLIFNSRRDISRAIFLSAPHRGSNLATNWVGRIGSKLVRAPAFIANARDTFANVVTADPAAMVLKRAPNSIDTLAPNNRFILEVNKIPLTKRIPFHSIIGDRGKGDTPDSSDGVVAYWSSHWDGAVSEKIVPSNHSTQMNPEGIAEVHRILLMHAGR
nr:alpha/beta fold hydrolase [Luteolibacter marinus]